MYYGLTEDERPDSAMYRSLFSLRALDGITGHLPVAFGAPSLPPRTILSLTVPPGARCWRSQLLACMRAYAELKSAPSPLGSCDAPGPRLCIVAVGAVPSAQIDAAAAWLSERGVAVGTVPALDLTNLPMRGKASRIRAADIAIAFDKAYPHLNPRKDVSVLILTPIDIGELTNKRSRYYAQFADDETKVSRYGVLSTFRVNPSTFGFQADDALWAERLNKLATRAAALLYFGLAPSEDPGNMLYSPLTSLEQIDAMPSEIPR
jgi:hypothetical protein